MSRKSEAVCLYISILPPMSTFLKKYLDGSRQWIRGLGTPGLAT
jgi:hypothetical protein